MSRLSQQNRERRNHPRTFCFLAVRGVAYVQFLLVFPFRAIGARLFCCRIVAFVLCVPCCLFGLNMHFSPFSELGTCYFVNHDDRDWSDPRTLLGVPSLPLSGSRPLLAVSASSRGWPARVSSSHTWGAQMWSAVAGAQGTGACSRLSPPVPGVHGGRGRTCRTPPQACSVSSQANASRKRVWKGTCRTRCVQGVASSLPCPQVSA